MWCLAFGVDFKKSKKDEGRQAELFLRAGNQRSTVKICDCQTNRTRYLSMTNTAGRGNLRGKDDVKVTEIYPKLIAISGHVLNIFFTLRWSLSIHAYCKSLCSE